MSTAAADSPAVETHHGGAPWKRVWFTPEGADRNVNGFEITCGEPGCEAKHVVQGPPDLPVQFLRNKFLQKGWSVSSGRRGENRCPTHAKRTPPGVIAKRPQRIPSQVSARAAANELFRPKPTPAPTIEPPLPPPAEPPVRKIVAAPHTIATAALQKLGLDKDLAAFAERADAIERGLTAALREIRAFKTTLAGSRERMAR